MESNYSKVFSGNSIEAQKIVAALHELGIEAVVKDETESGRLAGFPPASYGHVDLYVHQDELESATKAIKALS
jgi:hypothetical protein